MWEPLEQLVQLQDFDDRLRRLRQRRADLTAEAEGILADFAEREREIEARAQALVELRKQVDRKELDLKTREQHITKLTVQLNTAKTNKEYAALQHEIAGIKADASLLEDEILATMDRIEKEDAACRQARRQLAEERQKAEAHRQNLQAELQKLAQEEADLAKRRAFSAEKINPNYRQIYERLLQKQDGKAIVPALTEDGEEHSCGGCQFRLTSNTINRLMSARELIFCHSCGRILYLPDHPS